MSSLSIAYYGNIANNGYVIGKAIKKHSDIDFHLYLEDDVDLVQSPESEDPEIKDNYPQWIHKSKNWKISSLIFFWRPNILKELSKYDVVILSGRKVMLAAFLKNRTIFFVTGSDLTLVPFAKRYNLLFENSNKISTRIIQWFQRYGIKNVTEIWTQPFSPFANALQRLGVKKEQIKDRYFPVMVNTNLFTADPDAHRSDDKNLRAIVDNYKFVIFHPSRLMINAHPWLRDAGQWKQNDLLILAFADFLKKSNVKDAVLVMPERTVSPDVIAVKKIIEKLNISKNILWIKSEHPEGFTRKELVKFYSIADAVADDFGIGWFGSVVLEGFAIGKPVISYVDEAVMKILYPWHPFLSSDTRDGICEIITKLYYDKNFKLAQGELGKKWIDEFHAQHSASKIYVKQFMSLTKSD
jgi:glycosyltransferase involved in cell wall biosynthesis